MVKGEPSRAWDYLYLSLYDDFRGFGFGFGKGSENWIHGGVVTGECILALDLEREALNPNFFLKSKNLVTLRLRCPKSSVYAMHTSNTLI